MKLIRILFIVFILICLTDFYSLLTNPLFLFPLAFMVLVLYFVDKQYKNTTYYKITHNSLIKARFNVGNNGEYLIYKHLENLEETGAKFLFNVYVPKANGETSEIDVMMIHHKGIFVFESKNYSGWIFGNETQRMWTQTLPKGKGRSHKESFYNPIMQNRSHIKNLETFLGQSLPVTSIIVFSERCTLKKVQLTSNDIHVIKRNHVVQTVNKVCNATQTELLSDTDILDIYNRLYPFTQVDTEIKEKHIKTIKTQQTPNSKS